MPKLSESFVSSFEYIPPKDPELLLYDFYFLVAYADPKAFDKNEEQYAVRTAIETCVNHLHVHMQAALKYACSCELNHAWDAGKLAEHPKYLLDLPDDAQKFLLKYYKIYTERANDFISQMDPRFIDSQDVLQRDETLRKEKTPPFSTTRGSERNEAYMCVTLAQKKLGYTNQQVALVFKVAFENLPWMGGYGGKAWANIAETLYKLYVSEKLQEKIIWIDHAYDLQHNTGSIFTKLKSYYKAPGWHWIRKALDWKKYTTDLRRFYDMVSPGLKPLVGFIAYKKRLFLDQLEDPPQLPDDKFSWVGKYVKIKPEVKQGFYNSVDSVRGEVGILKHSQDLPDKVVEKYPGAVLVIVQFPSAPAWVGLSNEIEVAEQEKKESQPEKESEKETIPVEELLGEEFSFEVGEFVALKNPIQKGRSWGAFLNIGIVKAKHFSEIGRAHV